MLSASMIKNMWILRYNNQSSLREVGSVIPRVGLISESCMFNDIILLGSLQTIPRVTNPSM